MALTLADIERWDVHDVRDVARALNNRAASMDEIKTALKHLPTNGTWSGQAATAADQSLDKLGTYLASHTQAHEQAATAMTNAADEIEGLQKALRDVEASAEGKFAIDMTTGTVTPLPNDASPTDEEHIANALKQILASGEVVDGELAHAVNLLDGADPPGSPDPVPPAPALPDDPDEFTKAWNALSPEQKEAEFRSNHFIGNHPGMPFDDKTVFNERNLDELSRHTQDNVDAMQARYDQLARQQYMGDHSAATANELAVLAPQLQAAKHSLDEYHGVQNAMKAPPGGPRRYLGVLDDKGHGAVSVGNPDTATKNAVLVPGTGDDLTNIGDNTQRSTQMYNAALRANPNLHASDVAVTAWLGYDRPMSVLEQAPWPSYAQHGAAALDSFEGGMRASHVGPPSTDTVIGHSYGTTLVGAAASGGHHLAADNIIAVASPGMLVDHASDLQINPGGSVYAMTDPHDPIGPANIATQFTLGPNPVNNDFGAHDLYAGTGLGSGPGKSFPSLEAHSGYWIPGTPALANLGAVIGGVPAPYPATG